MQLLSRMLILAISFAVAPVAPAALSVDSMNFPAWVERGAEPAPLAPGDRLVAGDIVTTGNTGRVWLEAEDGSVIKLGQGARFVVDRARLDNATGETVFDAAFKVLRGAFRFTGSFFPRRRELPHRVDFQVGAVTAGIRGTDIWGHSGEQEDFVALLEGRIEVGSKSDAPRFMDQPLTLYRKPAGMPADGVVPVAPELVAELAPQTELSVDAGIVADGGLYDLVLASVPSVTFDAAAIDRFRRAGYPAKAVAAEVDGVRHTRIVLRDLVDLNAARNLRRTLAAKFGIDDAWISRRI